MNTTPTTDWQTWAALAVVALTATAFVIRFVLKKKNASSSGCSSDCGCAKPTLTKDATKEAGSKEIASKEIGSKSI